jgi:hypothetical protein
MASGVASPWGMSPPMVARLSNTLDMGNNHLTGQLSLTSESISFNKNGELVSPLTIQNASYYYKNPSNGSSFGSTLKSVKQDIRYLNKLKE